MPEETLIVLPDEKLLLPLLHSLPEEAGSYNVTMGFPLAATPIFNLAEALINLQLSERSQYFNHRPVTSLLNHPYLMASGVGAAAAKLGEMTKENRVWVSAGWLQQGNPLFASVFTPVGQNSIIQYLLRCAERVGEISALPDLEKEYVFQFIQLLNRMNVVLGNAAMELRSFHRMLRQMVASVRIPFTGEPLRGLQIMGVLETRNLDFRNVIILSMNEGAWPAISRGGSFVPYNIRKAFGIPTQEHHDAIYGYHFYRLLQRAENIHFLYSTETDVLGQGEMSRLLRQLEFESGWKIDRYVICPPVQPAAPVAITVHKSKAVMNRMAEYLAGSSPQRRLSPTALNAYRECRLMFYLRYVARIFELDEIEDEMDAREVGNLVHGVLERFYKGLEKRKKSRHVAESDFDGSEEVVNKLLDEFFRERYGAHQRGEFRYEGRAVVLREVALTFINRVLHHDRQYAPFELICLEENINMDVPIGGDDRRKVALTGKVDRADRKGDSVRIVDYKTGKDSLDMKDDPGELFGRDMKSGKAVLQTMLYTYLFDRSGAGAGYKLLPGLMTRANLFKADLAFGLKFEGRPLPDVRPMLPRLEEALGDFLAELYDEKVSFDQTPEIKNCRFCAYREICSR
jgi:CRISPR/Cas system-associated exonuclease Cas4 (RecB family)